MTTEDDKPKKKRKWRPGIEMPAYSGKTWKELHDIYPSDLRIKDDVWRMVGLFAPAWLLTQYAFKDLLGGETISSRDFMIMCWLQRVEEANENIGFRTYPAMKGMNLGGRIYNKRKAKLTKLGLIENMPVKWARLYRVTGMGKSMIKCFVDNLHQANENLAIWVDSQSELSKEHLTENMNKWMPGWNEGL